MPVKRFSDYKAWKQAVSERKLVTRCYTSHEGPHEDDMWEPTWAIKPHVYACDEMYGVFQNIPTDDTGTAYTSAGFLCDTETEFQNEMNQEEERHDAMAEAPHDIRQLH